MSEPFIGEIRICAYPYAPAGWTFCHGQKMTIPGNETLYSIIGTTYGGDARTFFCLPDLRGRQPLGFGSGPGLSPYQLAQTGGAEHTRLTEANLPEHSHETTHDLTASVKASTKDGTETTPAPDRHLAEIDLNRSKHDSYIYREGEASAELGGGKITGEIACGSAGKVYPETVDNLAPCLVMNYIIALKGIYPSRS